MKKDKYKKELQKLAKDLGLDDTNILAGYEDEITKQASFQLTNNARRFVKGILSLPEEEQLFRINRLKAVIAEQQLKDTKEST